MADIVDSSFTFSNYLSFLEALMSNLIEGKKDEKKCDKQEIKAAMQFANQLLSTKFGTEVRKKFLSYLKDSLQAGSVSNPVKVLIRSFYVNRNLVEQLVMDSVHADLMGKNEPWDFSETTKTMFPNIEISKSFLELYSANEKEKEDSFIKEMYFLMYTERFFSVITKKIRKYYLISGARKVSFCLVYFFENYQREIITQLCDDMESVGFECNEKEAMISEIKRSFFSK